jgi:tRNA 5-methylaminomethyl-2-thiouridine biosynthesis bifunctional protein
VPLPGPAWWYPGGGWLAPADLVRAWLRWPGVAFRGGTAVAAIRPGGPGWQALDAAGAVLAEAAVMVLAGADDSTRLLAPHGAAGWPVQRSRGQVSGWTSGPAHGLRLPVAAGSYALPLAADALLCGATHDIDDSEAAAREADDAHNFARLARLTGLVPPPGAHARLSRVGWRLHSADRLPIAGAVPMPDLAADTLQQVPRLPGLYVLGALGSRGITLAPLLGEVLATRIVGMPAPLERRLAEAVDPARWMVRAVRQARQQET